MALNINEPQKEKAGESQIERQIENITNTVR